MIGKVVGSLIIISLAIFIIPVQVVLMLLKRHSERKSARPPTVNVRQKDKTSAS